MVSSILAPDFPCCCVNDKFITPMQKEPRTMLESCSIILAKATPKRIFNILSHLWLPVR